MSANVGPKEPIKEENSKGGISANDALEGLSNTGNAGCNQKTTEETECAQSYISEHLRNKLLLFEYLLWLLIQWYVNQNNINLEKFFTSNDFSMIKVLKLLFFVIAIDSNKNQLLDDPFDQFAALPYGPVELDVYHNLGNLTIFKVDRIGVQLVNGYEDIPPKSLPTVLSEVFVDINNEGNLVADSLRESFKHLSEAYPFLINYFPFSLVDITHKWHSWKITYNKTKSENVKWNIIQADLIREDKKYFR